MPKGIYTRTKKIIKSLSESHKGYKHSDKTKELISKHNACFWKGKRLSDKHKYNIRSSKKNCIGTRKGTILSTDIKRKISSSLKNNAMVNDNYGMSNKKHSDTTRLKLRNAQINNIKTQLFNGLSAIPCVGKYEYDVLDYLESIWNCNIQRQKRVAGYFLDGYCPMFNLAIEIDEPQHKQPKRLKKDLYREEQIKRALSCSFLRINTP